jgi:hypothetical protein
MSDRFSFVSLYLYYCFSGGIERDWTGVPRQLYEPGSQTYRCACIREDEIDGPNKKGNIREYPDCNPKSTSCWIYS